MNLQTTNFQIFGQIEIFTLFRTSDTMTLCMALIQPDYLHPLGTETLS